MQYLYRKSKQTFCSITFFKDRATNEIMWKKYFKAEQASSDSTKRHMPIACWIPQAGNTHSEHVILYYFSTATTFARTLLCVTSYYIARPVRKRKRQNETNGAKLMYFPCLF